MRLLLAISWRNLWRNRRRTLISMSAAGLGLALAIFYAGMMEGIIGEARNQLDNTGMGHLEIYPEGWRPRREVGVAFAEPRGLLERLALPAGSESGARVVARGLATAAHGAQGVTLFGVDPATEAMLSAHFSDIRQGEPLAADDLRGVLIGEKLAEKLKLKVGHKLKMMVQRADGEMGADLFRVRGIFHSISAPISRATVYVTLPASQRLLGLGDAAHQIVVQLEEPARTDALAATLRARLAGEAEVVTYGELMPAIREIEELMDAMVLGITLFVFLLVGLGILNTMMMSVLERTREFGVMRALGARPGRIVSLVVAEAFWIALLAVLAGTALGLLGTWAGSGGTLLDFSSPGIESWEYSGAVLDAAVRTTAVPAATPMAAGLVFVLTTLIGIIPAWRVSRMEPARALRAN